MKIKTNFATLRTEIERNCRFSAMAAVISICLLPSAAELEDKQMSKVTFDYSKAAPFIGAHEVDFMKNR